MEQGDCAVAFIAFGDEKFPPAVPVGVRPENRDFSADIMRWMQTAFPQHMRSHRGRRGFAVHSNNENSALSRHDCSERFGAADSSLSVFPRAFQDRIVRFDGGRINNELGVPSIRGAMLLVKF